MDAKITLAFYRFTWARCYRLALFVSRAGVFVFALAFAGVSAWVFWAGGWADAARFAFVPALNYCVTMALRAIVRRKRPFERLSIAPPPGVKPGKSFPSNHAASAMIIAFACLSVNEPLGFLLFLLAIPVAFSRVCLGAHYAGDVAFAVAQSAAVAVVGFNVLPALLAL